MPGMDGPSTQRSTPRCAAGAPLPADLRRLRRLAFWHRLHAGLHGALALALLMPTASIGQGLIERLTGRDQIDSSMTVRDATLLLAMFGGITVALAAMVALNLLAARSLNARRRRRLCLAASGLNVMFPPFGTILACCTFATLGHATVRQAFAARSDDGAPAPCEPPSPARGPDR